MQLHPPPVRALRAGSAPVEYAVAVDCYLAGASLGAASRRVYRISLTSWAWPLVGRPLPRGSERRGAAPPIVPLALLDRAETGARLAAAIAERLRTADVRTVNRELSALRSAVGWWQDQDWLSNDPTAGIRHVTGVAAPLSALTGNQVTELFGLPVSLREQAFWRILHDSGGHADEILGLDAGQLDPGDHRAPPRPGGAADGRIHWRADTGQLVSWLVAGRRSGPVFLTDRRAPASAAPADICPVTGRARMSYRRAAEIFTTMTRPLDPAGRGWTLQQLSRSGPATVAGPR